MRVGAAQHLLSSSERLRAETGFTDPVSLEQAVERTLAWAADHREALGEAPDYEAREAAWAEWQASAPEPEAT